MYFRYEECLQKKQGAASHFQSVGVLRPSPIINNYWLQLKAYVRTARMPFAKVINFMTWSDFTILSFAKIGLYGTRKHRLIIPFRGS